MLKNRGVFLGSLLVILALPMAFIFRAAAVPGGCCFNQCANPNAVCDPFPTLHCEDFGTDPPCTNFTETSFESGAFSCAGSGAATSNCTPDGSALCYTVNPCVFVSPYCLVDTSQWLYYYMPVYQTVACSE